MEMMKRIAPSLGALVLLAACGETEPRTEDMCARDAIEADLAGPPGAPSGFAGPGVDPVTGAIVAPGEGGYVVSTTYLELRPEPAAQQRFGELIGALTPTLMASPGLVAMQLATSESCGTARTMTVWRDEESMIAFVASDAHLAAITSVAEVSRGGSVAMHWQAEDASQLDWAEAAAQLATHDGPEY